MNQGLLNSLTEAERLLVAETERDALKGLDEDELLDLHQRIRRARTKYVKNYRRAASAAVEARGGRGFSYPKNQRDRDKAELFELTLARVSRERGVRLTLFHGRPLDLRLRPESHHSPTPLDDHQDNQPAAHHEDHRRPEERRLHPSRQHPPASQTRRLLT